MAQQHQHKSVLKQLRALVPERALRYWDARRIVELQANHFRELLGITEPEQLDEAVSSLPRLLVRRVTDLPHGVSGVSQWHAGRWVIALNTLEPDTRQRFSQAHELFHIINHTTAQWLHPGNGRYSAYSTGERLADYFAACLLMPKRHVKALITQGLGLAHLASTFDVSASAMSRRLTDLGIADAVANEPPHVPRTRPTSRVRYYHRHAPSAICPEGVGA